MFYHTCPPRLGVLKTWEGGGALAENCVLFSWAQNLLSQWAGCSTQLLEEEFNPIQPQPEALV